MQNRNYTNAYGWWGFKMCVLHSNSLCMSPQSKVVHCGHDCTPVGSWQKILKVPVFLTAAQHFYHLAKYCKIEMVKSHYFRDWLVNSDGEKGLSPVTLQCFDVQTASKKVLFCFSLTRVLSKRRDGGGLLLNLLYDLGAQVRLRRDRREKSGQRKQEDKWFFWSFWNELHKQHQRRSALPKVISDFRDRRRTITKKRHKLKQHWDWSTARTMGLNVPSWCHFNWCSK